MIAKRPVFLSGPRGMKSTPCHKVYSYFEMKGKGGVFDRHGCSHILTNTHTHTHTTHIRIHPFPYTHSGACRLLLKVTCTAYQEYKAKNKD